MLEFPELPKNLVVVRRLIIIMSMIVMTMKTIMAAMTIMMATIFRDVNTGFFANHISVV